MKVLIFQRQRDIILKIVLFKNRGNLKRTNKLKIESIIDRESIFRFAIINELYFKHQETDEIISFKKIVAFLFYKIFGLLQYYLKKNNSVKVDMGYLNN